VVSVTRKDDYNSLKCRVVKVREGIEKAFDEQEALEKA
jgi:hypothetical protein